MTEEQAIKEYNYRRTFLRAGLAGTPAQIDNAVIDVLGTKEQYIAMVIDNEPLPDYILNGRIYDEPLINKVSEHLEEMKQYPTGDEVLDKLKERLNQTPIDINDVIQDLKKRGENIGNISDGYHTFDELYEHRIQNFIALCKVLNTRDGEYYRNDEHLTWRTIPVDGWFVLGIHREKGKQITYHLPESKYKEVTNIAILMKPLGDNFDGHTSADVLERLKAL